MKKYTSINELFCNLTDNNYKSEIKELISLLTLMENINPCNQEYEVINNNILITYNIKLNLLNFKNILPLKTNVKVIGLPISLCLKGYYGKAYFIEDIVKKMKGLKIILNGDSQFSGSGKTLSTFIFENKFSNFEDYLCSLRSTYRRRISKALKYRDKLKISPIKIKEFSKEHYSLYLSVMNRTSNPLETLPIEFFQEYESELYEFRDSTTNVIVGFIQLKEIKNKLYFLFGGFKKEDNEAYDLYYNMLLKIVEIGIEKHVTEIEFGQTAEESKLKIGCKEKYKYLYIHHSNPFLNFFIQMLLPFFSYKPYAVKHNVFKADKV